MERKLPIRLSECILPRRGIIAKMLLFLILLCPIGVSAATYAQITKFNIKMNNATVASVLNYISSNSDFSILYDGSLVKNLPNVSIDRTDVTVDEILSKCLGNSDIKYVVTNKTIVLSRKDQPTTQAQPAKKVNIKGKVIGPDKKPIPGATAIVLGTTMGAIVDNSGNYAIENVPVGSTLELSFVGYVTETKKIDGTTTVINFELKEDALKVDEVVVTGYFRKTKQSTTGSEVVVKGDALRQVGSLNFMQAISAFDPSVRMVENNQYGSDPNRVPEINIRGENGFDLRSSADDSQSNPNAPMYILDGLEVSATRVYDLDMNRVESFSILKDAAATSLYGSRGANGVILIQTIAPKEGELKVSVNANYNISVPDLRDYNLMNAREKLEYERLAKVYQASWGVSGTQDELDEKYNNKLKEINRGVDTYWLSRPLRTSLNQRYNVFIEGGNKSFRYGVDLKYDTDKGVMIGSGRQKLGGNVNLNYNINQKFYIINDITINDVRGDNSPYGQFSAFSEQNPYERIYDPLTGEMNRRYEYNNSINPLVNALLPNTDIDRYTELQDNLSLDWRVSDHFRINGRIGITKKLAETEKYRSPFASEFDTEKEINKKGSYTTTNKSQLDVDGNLTLAYNNTFKNDITLSAGIGSNITTSNQIGDGYTATGFLNDDMNFVQYAQQFKEKSTPTGSFDKSRLVGFFTNVNVGYKNRYFLDASFRTDGSSRFGKDSRFAPFWSVGGAWNLDKEKWWKGEGTMKIRASVGSTGSVNFSADQAITKYQYAAANEYNGIYGATLLGYGNSSLKWQNTLQYNIGLDLSIWKNIIVLNADAYIKQTQNLLLPIDVAPSTGFYSYTENMGSMENKGVDFRLRFNIFRERDLNWSVTLAGFHNSNQIKKLSNALEAMNAEAYKKENSGFNPNPNDKLGETAGNVNPLRIYEVGRSQSALMVVRSMGIDPATGNEIYRKLNGDLTFEYDPRDKIVVGDTNPTFEGSFQSNLTYKGFNLYVILAYSFGSEMYNETLARKVEGSKPEYNADKRVLNDRWKKPGDIAMFRRIDDKTSIYQSTRLVQKNDYVRLQTLSLSYQVPDEYLNKKVIERCKISVNASDLFRISTIKQERGTSYPFAQAVSIGVNITF